MSRIYLTLAAAAALTIGCSSDNTSATGSESTSGSPSASTTSGTTTTVVYSEIQSLLDANCVKCHGASNPKEGYSFVDHASLMKGGEDGPAVVVGDPENSLIIHVLRGSHGKPQMPKDASPLPEAEIAKFEAWIKEGAKA